MITGIKDQPPHKPNDRTTQAEPATTRAANTEGTKKSILDLLTICAGKHSTSVGSLSGILTKPFELHDFENDDDGDIAVTNAISGENDATATVTVKRTVHVVAYRRISRRVTIPSKIDRKNARDIRDRVFFSSSSAL